MKHVYRLGLSSWECPYPFVYGDHYFQLKLPPVWHLVPPHQDSPTTNYIYIPRTIWGKCCPHSKKLSALLFFFFLIQLLIETILTNLKIDVFINSVWFKGALLAWETDHTCHCQRKSEIKSTKKNINRITFPCNMNIQISETGIIEYTLCRLAVKQKKVWCQYDTTEATALFPVK